MSEWITDRRPTFDDAYTGWVWVTTEHGVVLRQTWELVFGRPWQPIVPPAPYVKPKRWTVMGDEINDTVALAEFGQWRFELCGLTAQHYAAAQRIADIYNEVLP
jgi:hypothetical protein